jgi:hypothetical protein
MNALAFWPTPRQKQRGFQGGEIPKTLPYQTLIFNGSQNNGIRYHTLLNATSWVAITRLSYPAISTFIEYQRVQISPPRPIRIPTEKQPTCQALSVALQLLPTVKTSDFHGYQVRISLLSRPFRCRPISPIRALE